MNRSINVQAYSACLAETCHCPTGVETYVVPARVTGLPQHLQSEQLIRLQIGLNMPQPIRDLRVAAEGVSGTLVFSGRPHFVVIPWHAIVWYGTLAELEAQWARERTSAPARKTPEAKPAPKGGVDCAERGPRGLPSSEEGVIWLVAFVALRALILGASAWGLTVSRSEGASMLLCVLIVFFAVDTIRTLVHARRAGP